MTHTNGRPAAATRGAGRVRRAGRADEGSAFLTVIVFTVIVGVSLASLSTISLSSMRATNRQTASKAAFYHAENALFEGVQRLLENEDVSGVLGDLTLAGGSDLLPYQADDRLRDATLSVQDAATAEVPSGRVAVCHTPGGNASLRYTVYVSSDAVAPRLAAGDTLGRCGGATGGSPPGNYVLVASATYNGVTRSVEALVRKNAPSSVFDYEYFLNNWGWWWGSTITGNGDNRSNWDFDFRSNPVVNGHIYANGAIESNLTPIDPFGENPPVAGLAGEDPLEYFHTGVPRVEMPNLLDFSHYEAKAAAELAAGTGGRLTAGSAVIEAVHGNATDRRGIYLRGTSSNPIVIDGTVVVHGDVIIRGAIRGQGTLYVGGNLYIARDVTYAGGPNFSPAPALMSDDERDAWVAANQSTDLVAFAVRESIFAGEVNSSSWKNGVYEASVYGLRWNGSEANLGADGIPGTPDDGVPFRDTDGDGNPDSAWYDADGDGVIDANYSYTNDIKMTDARANRIDHYPQEDGDPRNYDDVASDRITRLDGIFYTNHAFGLRTSEGPSTYNGSIISRFEAILFSTRLNLVYDERVHSRYNNDPNRMIDLGLPTSGEIRILWREEVPPSWL